MPLLTSAARTCLLFQLAWLGAAAPAPVPHGSVELVPAVKSIQPGSQFRVGLLFRLEPGWHIYWKNPGDSGQAPRIKWTLPPGITAGEIEWPVPRRLPVGPLLDYGYEGEVLLPVALEADSGFKAGEPQTLQAALRVLVCRETCVPGKADLTLALPVHAGAPALNPQYAASFEKAKDLRPKTLPSDLSVVATRLDDSVTLLVKGLPGGSKLSFIPAQNGVVVNAAPQSSSGEILELRAAPDAPHSDPLEGLLTISAGGSSDTYSISVPLRRAKARVALRNVPPATSSFGSVLLLAFAGGLILNLMPCVFPVLSLKVINLLEHSRSEGRAVRLSAVVYTAGVLLSFWVLTAVLVSLRAAGRNLGWGFQLQAPGFVAFLICLLFVLGLSMVGAFELGSSLMSVGSGLASQPSYKGSFFTGILATVVATPCTAPFMGVAVGFALGQNAAVAFTVFTSMALGLAAPFLFLCLFPQLGRLLPRPGAWMETLKQIMAFPIFATVIWLLWVLGQQAGVDELTKVLAALLGVSIAVWVAGRWASSRLGGTLALLAGLAVVFLCTATLESRPMVAATPTNASGLKWEPFSPQKLTEYRGAGKPILVDYTAAWCLTCQVNDRVVFHSPAVIERLNKSGVALLRADWTSYDPTITASLAEFGRSGIPFYVLYTAEPQATPRTLPDGLLSPSSFLEILHNANL